MTKPSKGLLQLPEVKQAMKRVKDAFKSYEQAGGRVYPGDRRMRLAVDVKIRGALKCAPEIRKSKQEAYYEHVQDNFWNSDLQVDQYAFEEGKYKWVYKELQCSGRSGGWCVFMDEHSATAAEAYCAYTRHAGGYTDINGALLAYNPDLNLETESKEAAEDIIATCNDLVDLFEPATETVKAVKDSMQFEIDNYEGRNFYSLSEMLEDNPSYFNFDNCVITIKDGIATVSWPQYKRKFKDRPIMEPCEKDDEGACSYSNGGEIEYKRPTGNFEEHVFEEKLGHYAKIAGILNPNIDRAINLLRQAT